MAEVRVSISKEGKPLEAVCQSADHYLLAEEAVNIVMKTEFTPGKSGDERIQALTTVKIPFIYQSSYFTSKSNFDHTADFAGFARPKKENKIIHCKVQELDEPLKIVVPPKPTMVRDEEGIVQTGSATIEGLIDTEGRFCMLSVVKSDNKHVTAAALESFESVEFAPPTKNGARATTRIRLPYNATTHDK
ncbi:energy transducer TonB [Puniceicoccaceae bacterium K14]|nr:energy transducer TonB [Puniceicoccaceae bacterium K14]